MDARMRFSSMKGRMMEYCAGSTFNACSLFPTIPSTVTIGAGRSLLPISGQDRPYTSTALPASPAKASEW